MTIENKKDYTIFVNIHTQKSISLTSSYKKFQEIIDYPGMVVPSMSEEEIRVSVLEAVLGYVEGDFPLETLTTITAKIQYFMGMRGASNTQIANALTKIISLSSHKSLHDNGNDFISNSLVEAIDELSSQERAYQAH